MVHNITHYLIFEGLDVVGEEELLTDIDVSSIAQLTNVVGLGMWNHQKLQYFDDLDRDEVFLTTIIDNEM